MNMLKSFGSKAKIAFLSFFALASSALASVSVDSQTGAISGNIDLSPYFSAAAVVLSAVASMIVVKWVIGLLKRS